LANAQDAIALGRGGKVGRKPQDQELAKYSQFAQGFCCGVLITPAARLSDAPDRPLNPKISFFGFLVRAMVGQPEI